MTARELAEILLQHPDDIVFVPVPEYSKMEPAVMTMREEYYTEKAIPGSMIDGSSFRFSSGPDPERYSQVGMCIHVCGES